MVFKGSQKYPKICSRSLWMAIISDKCFIKKLSNNHCLKGLATTEETAVKIIQKSKESRSKSHKELHNSSTKERGGRGVKFIECPNSEVVL